jgi:hypothetical protein
MNKELTRTHSLAGALISENAVRGASVRPRRAPSATPAKLASAVTASPPAAGESTSQPARGQRPLRRWSVAELIARAVAAPPAGGMSRG